jgi:hypothetical protein
METLSPVKTAPTVTLDVFEAAPVDLRSRLRAQPVTTAASLLPGGMILEESPEALVYRLAMAGAWRVETTGAEIRLTNDEGVTVQVVDGRLSLAIAK